MEADFRMFLLFFFSFLFCYPKAQILTLLLFSPDKGSLGLKEAAKHLQAASSGKGKGKRGRKPGSMIYEPKLEPPKFNPDLASLSSSNNFISSVGNSNSVTLTPVSSFSSEHKSGNFSSEARNSNSNSNNASKTPNVVVKLGKHGEVYHAKKDSPSQSNGSSEQQRDEGILERVSPAVEVKEECGSEKKSSGFTTANFTESFVTASVSVTAALIKSDTEPSGPSDNRSSPATRVKVEASEPPQDSEAPTSSLSSTSSSSSIPHGQASAASSPSPSAPLPTTTSSSGLVFSLEPQKAPTPPASSKLPVGLSKATVGPAGKPPSAMFPNRHSGPGGQQASPGSRHGLGSSVSLFPTSNVSAGSHMPKPNEGPGHPPNSSHHSSQPSHSSAPSSHPSSSHPSAASHSSNSTGHPGSLHSSVSITPSSVTSPSSTLTVSRMAPTSSQPVTISPVSLEAEPRLSHGSPTPNAKASPSALLSPRSKQQQAAAAAASVTGNGPVKRIGRPPKKGTHTTNSSLQGAVQTVDSEEEEVASSSKRARTDSGNGEKKEEGKKEGGTDNGMTARFMMFGATLNPTSGQAKDLNTVLQVNPHVRLNECLQCQNLQL